MFSTFHLFVLVISLRASAAASVSANLPNGWTYQGCYTDLTSSRVLSRASYTDGAAMTEESCISYCAGSGYTFAGAEYANECYCDFQIAQSSSKQSDTQCNMPCSGNVSEVCGAGNRLTVFSTSGGPTTNPGPSGWVSLGCYSDKTSARTIQYPEPVVGGAGKVTVAACTAECQSLGYQYAGVEYANECYCGSQIANGGSPISSGCNMVCSGNSSEFCGGPNALNLYQKINTATTSPPTSTPTNTPTSISTSAPLSSTTSVTTSTPPDLPTNYTYLGCYSDNSGSRSLRHTYLVPGGGANMTIENCLSTCQSNGYWYAGVEYGSQCWCDDFIQPYSYSGLCIDLSQCNMKCNGNAGEWCGGSNALNIYSYSPYLTASATCCGKVPASSSGLIQNGNFESGQLAPWNVDYITPASAQVAVVCGGESFSGCCSLRIRAINSGSMTNNQVSISQTMSGLTAGYKYTISLLSGMSTWNAQVDSAIQINVGATGRSALLYSEAPCGGSSCNYKGQSYSSFGSMGDNVFVAASSTVTLYINVTWSDQFYGNDLLIDGVTIQQGSEFGY